MAAKRLCVVKGNTPGKATSKRLVEGKSRRSLFNNETQCVQRMKLRCLSLAKQKIGLVKTHWHWCNISVYFGRTPGTTDGQ
jgi:hypothetical protein